MKKKRPTILLIRHGHRTREPHFDTHLTEQGDTQAKDLLKLLSSHKVTRIYSSPYLRCLETAHPLSEALQQGIYVDYRLSECFTKEEAWRYPAPRRLTTEEEGQYHVVDTRYEDVPKLETWSQIQMRTSAFLDDCMQTHTPDETIVVMTHMSTLNACRTYSGQDTGGDVHFDTPFPVAGIIQLESRGVPTGSATRGRQP